MYRHVACRNMHKDVYVVHAWMCVRAEKETQRKHDLYSFFTIDPRPKVRLRRVSGFSWTQQPGFRRFSLQPLCHFESRGWKENWNRKFMMV